MTVQDSQLNVLTLDQMAAICPPLGQFLERQFVKTYDDFSDILYNDIDRIIYKMQENAELRHEDGEDRLTIDIVNMLNVMGYNASHDEKHGGHTDILIKKQSFLWIGEAKKHSNYNYLWEGFQQLNTRYSTGDDNQQEGGIIIYITNKDANSVMIKWNEHLAEKKLPDYEANPCKKRKLTFLSTHQHEKSGLKFKVRHMPVLLHFEPQDKSGRKRKS